MAAVQDDEEVDETGVDKDAELVMMHATMLKYRAVKVLITTVGDIGSGGVT